MIISYGVFCSQNYMFEILTNSIMKIIPETYKTISMVILFSDHILDLNPQLENTLQFAKMLKSRLLVSTVCCNANFSLKIDLLRFFGCSFGVGLSRMILIIFL
jgi:hypothetical protein